MLLFALFWFTFHHVFFSAPSCTRRGVTIIDCIWSEKNQAFYALDLICWSSYSFSNCTVKLNSTLLAIFYMAISLIFHCAYDIGYYLQTEYRQFFLNSKLSELPEVMDRTKNNPFPIKSLTFFRTSDFNEVMTLASAPFDEEVDGILFFHKEAFYISSTNPLNLWIRLNDIPTILNVDVSPELMSMGRDHKSTSKHLRTAEEEAMFESGNIEA